MVSVATVVRWSGAQSRWRGSERLPRGDAGRLAGRVPHPRSSAGPFRQVRLAAASLRRRLDHRGTLLLRRLGLDGLDDRAVHAVGDLMSEGDLDLLETGLFEPCDVFALRERSGDAAD